MVRHMSRRKPRVGRPTLLTPEVVARLVPALQNGVPLEIASRWAGAAPSTMRKWLALGRAEAERVEDEGGQPDPRLVPHMELVTLVDHARSVAVVRAVRLIGRAAEGEVVSEWTRTTVDEHGNPVTETKQVKRPGDWKAAAWLLVRISPDEFAVNRLRERQAEQAAVVKPGSGVDFTALAERVTRNMQRAHQGQLALEQRSETSTDS